MTRAERIAMIARDRTELSVRRQCALLGLARSGVYRKPAPPDPEELAMRRIDEQYLATPFYGSRRMTAERRMAAHQVNRSAKADAARSAGPTARRPAGRWHSTGSIPTCSASRRSIGRTRCGPPTLRIPQWPAASSTWSW